MTSFPVTVECYGVLNFEVASFSCIRDIKKHHFVTAAAVDIDDSIKRTHIRVSPNNVTSYRTDNRGIRFMSVPYVRKFIRSTSSS